MARSQRIAAIAAGTLLLLMAASASGRNLVTCPGIAGYCSESYPGDVCLVVCAFGRNNVPQCQADGTWTDLPRCVEHEPGSDDQRTLNCPGVPGYCSISPAGTLCTFDCVAGPDVSSTCDVDGTWQPYPKCDGDVRETRDGCDSCPGPFGGPRNRTAEAAAGGKRPNRRRPTSPSGATTDVGAVSNRSTPRKLGGATKKMPGGSASGGQNCPASVLEACLKVCPSNPIRLFSACVKGCARRCA